MRLFSEREVKILAIGTAAVTIVAVSIAMIVAASRNRSSNAAPVTKHKSGIDLEVTDLAVPEEYREITVSRPYQFRPRLNRWNAEQIEKYWVDPRILQLEELARETDELIRALLKPVP